MLERINNLIKVIQCNPLQGIGKPNLCACIAVHD
ncbi:hypothetical protein [Xanthomonas sacchari]